jgi:hypothetical protein
MPVSKEPYGLPGWDRSWRKRDQRISKCFRTTLIVDWEKWMKSGSQRDFYKKL